jgi:hypothetical protein
MAPLDAAIAVLLDAGGGTRQIERIPDRLDQSKDNLGGRAPMPCVPLPTTRLLSKS